MNLEIKSVVNSTPKNGFESLGDSKVIRFLKFEKSAIEPFETTLVSDKILVAGEVEIKSTTTKLKQDHANRH